MPSVSTSGRSGTLASPAARRVGAVALELLGLVLASPVVRLALLPGCLVVGLGILLLLIAHLRSA